MPTGNSQIDRAAAIGIAVWLFVQLASLGICAARIPLFASAPAASEQTALVTMLAAQIATSALIFPHLLRTVGSTTLAVASAWPMAQLASFIADAPAVALIRGELYVTIWLLTLHLWNRLLPTPSAKLLGSAVASLITLGGPVLCYLQMEFNSDGTRLDPALAARFGPLMGAIFQTFPQFSSGSWLPLGLLYCCAASINAFLFLRKSSRQVIH